MMTGYLAYSICKNRLNGLVNGDSLDGGIEGDCTGSPEHG